MVEAMVLGGLRRCEVLGLRMADLKFGDRRVFIVEGKGGHQRQVPISKRFFDSVANYLARRTPRRRVDGSGVRGVEGPEHRPAVVAKGLDQIVLSARERAGLDPLHVSRAAPHVSDPAARGRHVVGGGPGPGRAPHRSSRRASTCTCRTTGSPTSISAPSTPSTPTPSGSLTRSSRSEPTDDRRTRHRPDGADRAVVRAGGALSPVGVDHALLPGTTGPHPRATHDLRRRRRVAPLRVVGHRSRPRPSTAPPTSAERTSRRSRSTATRPPRAPGSRWRRTRSVNGCGC